jgi:hypothetical protein
MAKIESSAVNELIDLVARRPLARDSGDDLLFARPKSAQPANESNRPKRKSAVRMVAAPASVGPIPHLRLVPVANAPRPPVQESVDHTWAVTLRRRLQNATPILVAKLALGTLALVIAGIAIGHFVFGATSASEPHSAVARKTTLETAHVAPPAIPAAAIAPAITAPTPAPAPKQIALVDVRVESTPPGATVTLVDNGKSSFIGTTPVDASVDPTRSYDIVLTRDGQPSRTEHLDPKATQRLTVVLETPAATKIATATPAATATSSKHGKKPVAKKTAKKSTKKSTKKSAKSSKKHA